MFTRLGRFAHVRRHVLLTPECLPVTPDYVRNGTPFHAMGKRGRAGACRDESSSADAGDDGDFRAIAACDPPSRSAARSAELLPSG